MGSIGLLAMLALAAGIAPLHQVRADNGSEGGGNGGENNFPIGAPGVATTTILNATGTLVIPGLANIGEGEGQGGNSQGQQGEGAGPATEGASQSSQESATINPGGHFSLTGATVVSVDPTANTITATLYGWTKTENVSGATITGGNSPISLSSINPGDILSATGDWNEAAHTVTITTVNDVSYAQKNNANIQSQINNLLQLVQQLQAQLRSMQPGSGGSSN